MNFGGQESTREGEKFRGTLNSIAYGEVMAAAAKNIQKVSSWRHGGAAKPRPTPLLPPSSSTSTPPDRLLLHFPLFYFSLSVSVCVLIYFFSCWTFFLDWLGASQEMMDAEASAAERNQSYIDMDDLLDDPDLQKIHEERIAQLKEEAEKRALMKTKGHGTYEQIEEGKFLEVVTKTEIVVVHFFHKEFERCKIVDKHLKILAEKYFDTKFVKISAPDSPFFVEKLGIRMLPCIIIFHDGVTCDRIVGFEELGSSDDFSTAVFERRLKQARALRKKKKTESDDEVDDEDFNRIGRSVYAGERQYLKDEDSDFSDSD